MKRSNLTLWTALISLVFLLASPCYGQRTPTRRTPEKPAGIRGLVSPEWSVAARAIEKAKPTAPGVKTVRVDCDKGESVNKALKEDSGELIIEISGICEEFVLLDRSNVTLRGEDPSRDGIRGEGGHPKYWGVLQIVNAHFIHFENLTLAVSGDQVYAVIVDGGNYVFFDNCRLQGPYPFAVGTSYVRIEDSSFSGDGSGVAIDGYQGSMLRCAGCDFSGFNWVVVNRDSYFIFRDSEIQGTNGVLGWSGGAITELYNTTIDAEATALYSSDVSEIYQRDGSITGSATAEFGGRIWLWDVVQTVATDNAAFDATLILTQGAKLVGDVWSTGFGKVLLYGNATIDGNLDCSEAGDAFCVNPNAISGGVSGCGSCVKP